MDSQAVSPLVTLRSEVPVLDPGDPLAEVGANTYGVTLSEQERSDAGQVVDSLQALAQSWLRSAPGRATFYAWYDGQAGQLRFSATSLRPHELPFGSPVRLLSSPNEVVHAAVHDPMPGFIPWTDLEEVDGRAEEVTESPRLPVWAVEKH